MNQHKEQLKATVTKQIKEATDPMIKKILEKRLKEIDKTITK